MKWEENVRKVVPYTPGEQPDDKRVIKLNTNENPYPPAPGVADKLATLKTDQMRLYPAFPEQTQLAEALADYYGIGREELFIGVGSDDVLSLAFMTFFSRKSRCFFLILPTLSMMCGRIYIRCLMRGKRWMSGFASG